MPEGGPLLFDGMGMDERFGALGVVTVCLLQAGCVTELPDPATYVLDGTGEPEPSASTTSVASTSGFAEASTGNDPATSGVGTTLAVAADETSGDLDGSSGGVAESTGDPGGEEAGSTATDETVAPAESSTGAEPEPGCTDTDDACAPLPDPPVLLLETRLMKEFVFGWEPREDVEHYHLEERPSPQEAFVRIAEEIRESSLVLTVPLHLRHSASYRLLACNAAGCTPSEPVAPEDALMGAIGYFKASDGLGNHNFGFSLAMSRDGRTLAVGAPNYNNPETGTQGVASAGAAYVYTRGDDGNWQEAVLNVTPHIAGSRFGTRLALSGDGRLLVVAAVPPYDVDITSERTGRIYTFVRDASGAWTLEDEDGLLAMNDPMNTAEARIALSADGSTLAAGFSHYSDPNVGQESGVVRVYGRDGAGWSLQGELQPSNIGAGDGFGRAVALSAEGNVLAVGAHHEDGNAASTIGASNNSASNAGAVYTFERNDAGAWVQQRYLKARDALRDAAFGASLSFGGDDTLLAVGAPGEGNNQAGVAYVFERTSAEPGAAWQERVSVRAAIEGGRDWFGYSVALDGRGELLFVGAANDGRDGAGVFGHPDGIEPVRDAPAVGAVYVFQRGASIGNWPITAYLKSSVSQADLRSGDRFGDAIAINHDGQTVAVGAHLDDHAVVRLGDPPAIMSELGPNEQNDAGRATGGSGAVFLY